MRLDDLRTTEFDNAFAGTPCDGDGKNGRGFRTKDCISDKE